MKNVVKEIKLAHELDQMLKIDRVLYEKIMDTPGFAYHFNNICNMARDYKPDEVK